MRKSYIVLASLTVIGLGALIALPLATPTTAGTAMMQVATTEKTATFKIENMTCAMCPITVRAAMQGVEGVASVKVDYVTKTALVVFDPAKTNAEQIAEASTFAGYPATAQATAKGS